MIALGTYISGDIVERILSTPVSLSYTGTMNSGFYQYITSFIVTGSIWNTYYLEYSHTLLVSASFTGFTHSLYTIGFLVYLENQSILIQPVYTFNSWAPPRKRNANKGLIRHLAS